MAKPKKIIADIMADIESEASLFLTDEPDTEADLIAAEEDLIENELEASESVVDVGDSELAAFESAEIEDIEFVEDEQLQSIVESILFASDRPVSLASIQMVFKGTNIKKERVKRALESLAVEYAGGKRGVVLEEITTGYQIRTKIDNMNFLKRTVKTRTFRLSGPALETLAIVAYKQPVVKIEIDQIRGVESGHLLRALMEKGLVHFEGKAENLPGKPMQYGTSRKFLEIFGLRNLKELPTLSQIDELLPEGIGEEVEEKQTLSMVTESMAENLKDQSYSQGEEELGLIENQLTAITTSSEFFEQEKIRQKMKRDEEKAQNIREMVLVGEDVPKRDLNWLKKHDEGLLMPQSNFSAQSPELPETQSADSEADEALFEGEDAHIEDEIPFEREADDDDEPSEEGHV